MGARQKEKPGLVPRLSCTQFSPERAVGLLLTGLRLPATLLTRLLVGVLGQLARILIRIAHFGLHCLTSPGDNFEDLNGSRRNLIAGEQWAIGAMNLGWAMNDQGYGRGTGSKNNPVQALLAAARAVAARGSKLLENATTRPGSVIFPSGSPWIISPSNSSTASCSARSTA